MTSRTPNPQPRFQHQQKLQNYSDSDSTLHNSDLTSPMTVLENDNFTHSQLSRLTPRKTFWNRLCMLLRKRRDGPAQFGHYGAVRLDQASELKSKEKSNSSKQRAARACVMIPLLVVLFFGVVHILNEPLGFIPVIYDDQPSSSPAWTAPENQLASHLLEITHDVMPVRCHSHNDYWRQIPLYDALRWGCTGVEADVYLAGQELLVGHSKGELKQDKTLQSMYVGPLLKLLDHRNKDTGMVNSPVGKNGIFDMKPDETLVLLIDFKSNGRDTFPYVFQHLAALREKNYLSYYDGKTVVQGPITVVATGNAPFDMVIANATYRDIFFDAPLDRLYIGPRASKAQSKSAPLKELSLNTPQKRGQGNEGTTADSHFDSTNSYYTSVNFGKSIGWLWFGHITNSQLGLIRGQIKGAHERGLKARYWSAPKWPAGLRNKAWKMMVEEGVDYLNGDDLQGMTKLDWSVK